MEQTEPDNPDEGNSQNQFEVWRYKMKPLKNMKTRHAVISAAGLSAAVLLVCGAVWAEKDSGKINVQTEPSASSQVTPAPQSPAAQDPFRDLMRMQRDMERMFSGRPALWSSLPFDDSFGNDLLEQPDMDLHEQAGAYQVKMDLPGMDKSGITVEVKDNVLTVSAERRQATEKKDGDKVLMKERSSGYVSRSVMLPKAVDVAKVDAEYRDGVLNITLPKIEKDQMARHVEIK